MHKKVRMEFFLSKIKYLRFACLRLICLLFMGCDLYTEYPSYSGIYSLIEQQTSSSEVKLLNFPINFELYQGALKRKSGINGHDLIAIINNKEGGSFVEAFSEKANPQLSDYSLLFKGRLNNKNQIHKSLFKERVSIYDTETAVPHGAACKIDLNYNITVTLSPNKEYLDEAYTICSNKIKTYEKVGMCIRSNNWMENKVFNDYWEWKLPAMIEVKISISADQLSDYCPAVYNKKIVHKAIYQRSHSLDVGDLRNQTEEKTYNKLINYSKEELKYFFDDNLKVPNSKNEFLELFN